VVTRNESAVLEKKGYFRGLIFNTSNGLHTGQFTGAIDLRLLLNNWHYGFLVIEERHIDRNKSLQFFDSKGQAVLKIYMTQNSKERGFAKLIAHFISSQQPSYLDITKEKDSQQLSSEQDIEWRKVCNNWQKTQNSHDFFQLLIGAKVTRQQAYDIVGRDLAYEIVPSALQHLCEVALNEQQPLALAVGNKGSMQLHNGTIQKANEYGRWFNILNENFNLHINTHRLTQAWVVRKPHQDGPITSVEFFDDNDHLALQISIERKEGIPEPTQRRKLVAQLAPRSLEISALNAYDAIDS